MTSIQENWYYGALRTALVFIFPFETLDAPSRGAALS